MALLVANIALIGTLQISRPTDSDVAEPATPQRAASPGVIAAAAPSRAIVSSAETSAGDAATTSAVGSWRDWIARNPHSALEWAASQPPSQNREAVLVSACFEIANTNPAEAVALAEKHALTQRATLANLTAQWAQKDLPAARARVLATPPGEERNELVARVGLVWSESQPSAAADFIVCEIPSGPAQTEAAICILHQWALRSFDDAAAWVTTFPDREVRERAINELAGIRDYSLAEVPR